MGLSHKSGPQLEHVALCIESLQLAAAEGTRLISEKLPHGTESHLLDSKTCGKCGCFPPDSWAVLESESQGRPGLFGPLSTMQAMPP